MQSLLPAALWRAGLVASKALGQRPLVPWAVVWTELTGRWDYQFDVPSFDLLEEDKAEELVLLQAGRERYWVPMYADRWGLGSMYKAVFNPRGHHYYEFKGCTIRPGDVVVDGGACEGFFTRFALGRGANVIAVEPWSKMYEALRRTYEREISEGKLQLVRALLSDKVGMSRLSFDPTWPYGALQNTPDDSVGQSEPVEELTVSELVERSPWRKCDFIKMDIEGAEPRAIVGSEAIIRRDHPNLAIAVYHRASDYQGVLQPLLNMRLGYQHATKGMIRLPDEPVWRPRILHAWDPNRPTAS